jgi:hypothetical protein
VRFFVRQLPIAAGYRCDSQQIGVATPESELLAGLAPMNFFFFLFLSYPFFNFHKLSWLYSPQLWAIRALAKNANSKKPSKPFGVGIAP